MRTLAGAVVGAMTAVALAAAEQPGADLPELIDGALAVLEGGLAL